MITSKALDPHAGSINAIRNTGRSGKWVMKSASVNFAFDFNMASGTYDSHFIRKEDLGHEHCVFQPAKIILDFPRSYKRD